MWKLGPWEVHGPTDHRRYWMHDTGPGSSQLAACVGTTGFRVWYPDQEKPFLDSYVGKNGGIENNRKAADKALGVKT